MVVALKVSTMIVSLFVMFALAGAMSVGGRYRDRGIHLAMFYFFLFLIVFFTVMSLFV